MRFVLKCGQSCALSCGERKEKLYFGERGKLYLVYMREVEVCVSFITYEDSTSTS
jgi:hypothetical protein